MNEEVNNFYQCFMGATYNDQNTSAVLANENKFNVAYCAKFK